MKSDEMSELQVRKDKAEKKLADANREAELMREKLQRKLGAKYLIIFSSRSLKMTEKCIRFAQLVLLSLYIFKGKCVT